MSTPRPCPTGEAGWPLLPMRDFLAVASEIVRDDRSLVPCLPAIEKELLHFEILRAMHDAGHLQHLTFKGGTCLRLCYGGRRFSEDLDFSGGSAFDHHLLQDIEQVLRNRIVRRYGLEVTVSSPKLADGGTRKVNRWIARIVTRPASGRSPLGVQRIKIEIDGMDPQPDVARLPIRPCYALLEDDLLPFPIRAASMADICSDKMVAYPMSVLTRENPRHRDVWDMEWLARRLEDGRAPVSLAAGKAVAWHLQEQLSRALMATVANCSALVESEGFRATLQRFVPQDLAIQTIANPDYRKYLASTVEALCRSVLSALNDSRPTVEANAVDSRSDAGAPLSGQVT